MASEYELSEEWWYSLVWNVMWPCFSAKFCFLWNMYFSPHGLFWQIFNHIADAFFNSLRERIILFFFLFVKEILIQSSYTTCMLHSVEWRLKRLSSWWKWTTMLCCYFSSLESSSFIWSFLKEILTLFLMGTAKKRYASQPIFFSFSGQEKKRKGDVHLLPIVKL